MLDTSVFIASETGRPLAVDRIPDEVAASAVTLAELRAGVLVAADAHTRARRLSTLETLFDIGAFKPPSESSPWTWITGEPWSFENWDGNKLPSTQRLFSSRSLGSHSSSECPNSQRQYRQQTSIRVLFVLLLKQTRLIQSNKQTNKQIAITGPWDG